ncbi:hypothetical protein LRP88_08925 [Fusarium phalaenopsidis]
MGAVSVRRYTTPFLGDDIFADGSGDGAGDKKSGNGESHDDDNTSIGADHPRSHLYATIQGLVNKVKNAHNAFNAGVLLPRFIDPYGEMAGDMERVAMWLREMGQGWMLSINGKRLGNDSATARNNDTVIVNAASQAPSAQ